MGGLLPIPFAAIDGYASRMGIAAADQFDELLALIGEMDAAYLEETAKQAKNRPA